MEVERLGCMNSFVDQGSVESCRYFLARRTVLEMLRDRGYPIPAEQINLTLDEFRSEYGESPDRNRLSLSYSLSSQPNNKVHVIFCGTEPVKLAVIREIYMQVGKENLYGLILILQSKMTSKAREAIKDIFKFKVETFHITELLVNITKHVLKPRHDVLTEEEKQKLLKKYNVEDSQLPRMLETDAIARYYGLQKGQVVKVTYDGELTRSHVTYRCIM
ncbi:DNA-directed RNA polymerase V subunit 5A isoform X1 [Elaeis guineensis]|uniref:DNA-directed RNA polymerase V subunit 5A isoform X1 n=1 Tax=Elaeis guineensis var. tenera TaxID=51953 RepID=A0A6I9RET1_ELAGV|nr:DNA-directed RNA polymerase V subunit 5A isoform X1 [Elaeis guineensis]